MSTADEEATSLVQVRKAGMDLLARREHTRLELRRKLRAKGFPEAIVEEVLAALARERLQSDERFAESFVAGRIRRGQGPTRIAGELRQRGIADALAEAAIASAGTDWQALAREVRHKRFGKAAPRDFADRARQARFLQYRGFTTEQAMAAVGERE
jgi:regulatory protein